MKAKKFYILAISLLFTCATFAGINRNSTDNWLQKPDESSLRATKPTSGTDIGDASSTPGVSPVGDGVWFMFGLGLTYGLYLVNKNRKAAE